MFILEKIRYLDVSLAVECYSKNYSVFKWLLVLEMAFNRISSHPNCISVDAMSCSRQILSLKGN